MTSPGAAWAAEDGLIRAANVMSRSGFDPDFQMADDYAQHVTGHAVACACADCMRARQADIDLQAEAHWRGE